MKVENYIEKFNSVLLTIGKIEIRGGKLRITKNVLDFKYGLWRNLNVNYIKRMNCGGRDHETEQKCHGKPRKTRLVKTKKKLFFDKLLSSNF